MMYSFAKKCLLLATAATILLSGCATSKNQADQEQLATGETRPLPFAKITLDRKASTLSDAPIHVDDSQDKKSISPDRNFAFPGRISNRETNDKLRTPYPNNLLKGIPDPNTQVTVQLAFNAADLSEVVAAFAAPSLLNFSYLVDPSVKGAVTLSVDTQMTAKDAWQTFEHILWLSGAYASMNSGFIHILPFDKMPRERRLFATHSIQPNVVVDFTTIRYKKSADIANQLKPFITEGASITDLPDSNTLVIVEAPANIEKIRELVSRLDSKGEREWPCGTFQCSEVEADILADELQQLLPVLGYPVATGTGASGGAIKLVALPRVGCIIVSAALPEVVNEVGKWIKAIDRSDMLDKEEIFFYNVTHTTVDKLASAMEAFFNTTITYNSSTLSGGSTSSSSKSSSSSLTSSSSSSSNSSSSRSTTSTRNTSSNRNNKSSNNKNKDKDDKLTTSVFDTEVIVFADQESNRLTIKTTPRTWSLIKAFLDRHDVPSRQVSIKAIITEITLDKSTEFGVSYAASQLIKHNSIVGSGAYAGAGQIGELFKDAAGTAVTSMLQNWGSAGLGLVFQKGTDPLALVTAVAGEGRTKILSEPQLIVVSGSEAYLQAGQQIAVPTETTNYTNSSGNTSTNYEYKDVGVIMTVTPYITAGNEVRLTIQQEVSAVEASSTNTNNSQAPNFSTKKISTEMTVKDNSTILMGGMIKNSETVTRSGIPFLRDIPILGLLFGYDNRINIRTELLVLITVNVIDPENFQDELIRRYKNSLEEIAKSQKSETY